MDGLDGYITQSDNREPREDEFQIDSYEELGPFRTYAEALDIFINKTNIFDKKFPKDYIYKIKGVK